MSTPADVVLFEYLLRLGDNALILSQRLGERIGIILALDHHGEIDDRSCGHSFYCSTTKMPNLKGCVTKDPLKLRLFGFEFGLPIRLVS